MHLRTVLSDVKTCAALFYFPDLASLSISLSVSHSLSVFLLLSCQPSCFVYTWPRTRVTGAHARREMHTRGLRVVALQHEYSRCAYGFVRTRAHACDYHVIRRRRRQHSDDEEDDATTTEKRVSCPGVRNMGRKTRDLCGFSLSLFVASSRARLNMRRRLHLKLVTTKFVKSLMVDLAVDR